jgi:hypothetical protein
MPDFDDVRKIVIKIGFAGDNKLGMTLQGRGSFIEWRGPIGADGARVAMYDWNKLRGSARIAGSVVRYVRLAVAVGVASALGSIAIVSWISGTFTLGLGAAAVALVIFGLVFVIASRGERSTFRAIRARFNPYQREPDRPAWREPVFIVNVVLQVFSLLVAFAAVVLSVS